MVKKRGHLLDRQMSKFTKQFQHFRPKKVRSSLQQCGVDIDIKILDFTLEFRACSKFLTAMIYVGCAKNENGQSTHQWRQCSQRLAEELLTIAIYPLIHSAVNSFAYFQVNK